MMMVCVCVMLLLVLLRLFDFFRLDTSATLKSDVSAFIYRAVKESPPGRLQGFIAMNELGLTHIHRRRQSVKLSLALIELFGRGQSNPEGVKVTRMHKRRPRMTPTMTNGHIARK